MNWAVDASGTASRNARAGTVRRYGISRYSRSVWDGAEPQRLLDAEGARQGVINQSADSYFAVGTAERNPALLTGQGAGGHIARINAVSAVTEIQEEITSRMPSGPEAARLDIPEGTPVFDIIRSYHTVDGVLDVARFVVRADMAAFDYRFPVPD